MSTKIIRKSIKYILVLALLLIMPLKVYAYADNNTGDLPSFPAPGVSGPDTEMQENHGSIGTLYATGKVDNNFGSINECNGEVGVNENGAVITTCSSHVGTNFGNINQLTNTGVLTFNKGTVGTNNATIEINEGTIETNASIINDMNSGSIGNNTGTVYINNPASAITISSNASSIIINSGTVNITENSGSITINGGTVNVSKNTGSIIKSDGATSYIVNCTDNYGTISFMINSDGSFSSTNWYVPISFDGCDGTVVSGATSYNGKTYVKYGNTLKFTLPEGYVCDNSYAVKNGNEWSVEVRIPEEESSYVVHGHLHASSSTEYKSDENKHWKECDSCHEKVNEESHNPVTDPRVEPTETSTGLTEGSHCRDCNRVLVAQNTIPKKKKSGGGGNKPGGETPGSNTPSENKPSETPGSTVPGNTPTAAEIVIPDSNTNTIKKNTNKNNITNNYEPSEEKTEEVPKAISEKEIIEETEKVKEVVKEEKKENKKITDKPDGIQPTAAPTTQVQKEQKDIPSFYLWVIIAIVLITVGTVVFTRIRSRRH